MRTEVRNSISTLVAFPYFLFRRNFYSSIITGLVMTYVCQFGRSGMYGSKWLGRLRFLPMFWSLYIVICPIYFNFVIYPCLVIHKVTIGASLSTRTSPTTESITPLNPRINLEKSWNKSKKMRAPMPSRGTWTRMGRFHHKEGDQLIYDQFATPDFVNYLHMWTC